MFEGIHNLRRNNTKKIICSVFVLEFPSTKYCHRRFFCLISQKNRCVPRRQEMLHPPDRREKCTCHNFFTKTIPKGLPLKIFKRMPPSAIFLKRMKVVLCLLFCAAAEAERGVSADIMLLVSGPQEKKKKDYKQTLIHTLRIGFFDGARAALPDERPPRPPKNLQP